ncbi:MAG: DNA/RNA non-specific endonuclease [Bacteroidales bacterium]|nr:DNA/RNA non-specific endonuclease [Bacteroidales bacterium]
MTRKDRSMIKKVAILAVLLIALIANWLKPGETGATETAQAQTITTADTATTQGTSYEIPVPSDTTAAKLSDKTVPHQLLQRSAYTASYNCETRTPNWVGWVLTRAHTDGEYNRNGRKFMEDTDVPEPRAAYSDIRESECGYQRGHMCPSADNKWSYKAQTEAFLMTNICPQNGELNQKDWKYLEEACRDWANKYGAVYIVAGPIFTTRPLRTVGEHEVAVPDAFFKVVLRTGDKPTDTAALGFIYPNTDGEHEMSHYVKTVDEVEAMTGLDFFSPLDDEVENQVEAKSDLAAW